MNTTNAPLATVDEIPGVETIQGLGSPDRRIDAAIHRAYRGFTVELRSGPISDGLPVPFYTRSLDAVIDLAQDLLPGWSFGVSTSSLTDDVWLMPGDPLPDSEESTAERSADACQDAAGLPGLKASFPPTPRAAMSLLAVLIEVKTALDEQRSPDEDAPAARRLFSDATAVLTR